MKDRDEVRGAGRGGGLLFAAVLLFVVYLAATAMVGPGRVVAVAVLAVVVVALVIDVLRRR